MWLINLQKEFLTFQLGKLFGGGGGGPSASQQELMAKQQEQLDRQEATIAKKEKEEKERKEARDNLIAARQGRGAKTLFDTEEGVNDGLGTNLGGAA